MSGFDGTAPPPPPAGGELQDTGIGLTRYGGLGKRFLARLIDGLLVGIPISIILAVLPGIPLGGFVAGIVSAAAGFGYFVYLETTKGATIGKQLLSLRVTEEVGTSPISSDASMRRNAWMLIGALSGIPVIGALASLASLVIVIAIAVTLNGDDRKQGLHDRMGGTLVVEA
jgi:uncharacterized RDD family membrane protein YckC